MFSRKAKLTFENLTDSAREHRLCLTRCEDIRTGKPVYVICEQFVENGVHRFNPIARLFSGNPGNEVTFPGISAPKMI